MRRLTVVNLIAAGVCFFAHEAKLISFTSALVGFAACGAVSIFLISRELVRRLSFLEGEVSRKVAERESIYFDLYDNSPEMHLSVDSKTGKVIQCNKTLLSLTGYEESEVKGRAIYDLYHPNSREKVRSLFTKFLATGRLHDEELQILRKDGSSLDISLNSTSVRDAEGNILHSRSSWRDISKRKQAERELEASKAQFQTLVETLPQFVWATNASGQMEFANKKWLEYSGMSPSETDAIENVHPEDRDLVQRVWEDSFKTGTPFEAEYRLKNANDGTYRWFLGRSIPIRNPGGAIVRWLGTSTDIEESKRAKEEQTNALIRERSAEESSRVKSEFLAMISHEIRTPLNTVVAMSELLTRANLGPNETEYAKAIQGSTEVLLALINDILDLSKIESGKMELDLVEFNLRELVLELSQETRLSAANKGLDFVLDGLGQLPEMVQGDPLRLRQILSNLLGNALKFTKQGQITLRSMYEGSTRGGHRLKFEVVDTGIGIDPTTLPKLFSPFTQADSSTTRRYGGTGLGLSICKKLLQMMKGTIRVDSEVGRGTKFEVSLTLGISQKQSKAIESATRRLKRLDSVARILVADDVPTNQMVLNLFLKELGCEVVCVANGLEVLRELEGGKFDLVFMDCFMPEKDGYETTREIRQRAREAFHDIPIIAVTANAADGEREKCLDAGMNDFITKPVQISELQTKLNYWLHHGIVDWSVLNELKLIDPASFESTARELIDVYLARGPERMARIEEAVASKNAKELQRQAHALKSASAYLGTKRIQKLCRRLEEAGASDALEGTPLVVAELIHEFALAASHLRSGPPR